MRNPFVLLILDGFGYREETEFNAIHLANTPNWDQLWKIAPHVLIDCSGKTVGLPDKQMGNSEVGHMNIGAGRVIYQDLTRIDNSIANDEFSKNPTLTKIFSNNDSPIHVCGLVSDGGVHSHVNHLLALIKCAEKFNINKLHIHAFLDGRDTPPKSALKSLLEVERLLTKTNTGKIVSLCGRYFAMDRDNRRERTTQAFNLLTHNFVLDHENYFCYPDISTALEAAYTRNETDEFVKPTIIAKDHKSFDLYKIKSNDSFIFMNFRADRARQLSHMLLNKIKFNTFATLTEYEKNLTQDIIYAPQEINNTLGEYLSQNNLTQLRIAETEKYAHVTFFLNGGREEPFLNEDRILIPSPKVATYDLKPEMSAYELTDKFCEQIESHKYDAIICNYANADMVGHTGKLDAAIKAVETVDLCLGKIIQSIKKSDGHLFITADHGNAECMYNSQTKQPHTAHTTSLVPLVYFSNNNNNIKYQKNNIYTLTDIAPTILTLMGLKPPQEMTGKIIFK